jgi:hypothetical protein
MSWEIAYENQLETWAFWQSHLASPYIGAFLHDLRKKNRGSRAESIYSQAVETESAKLLEADPIYVEDEMMTVWEKAAEGFEPEPFEASDLLGPAGFVYLPRPMYLTDLYGKRCAWRAFAWGTSLLVTTDGKTHSSKPGISLSLYSHRDDADDYGNFHRDWEEGTMGEGLVRYPLTLLHLDHWAYGDRPAELAAEITAEEYGRAGAVNAMAGFQETWRNIQSLFRLMQQTITTPVEREAPRATRRRAKRQPDREIKPVTVIQLRRPKKPRQGEERDVDWTHRWLVGGHWRNQWYPTLGIHRQRYIAPYVKGPEDKELRIREKRAWELVR